MLSSLTLNACRASWSLALFVPSRSPGRTTTASYVAQSARSAVASTTTTTGSTPQREEDVNARALRATAALKSALDTRTLRPDKSWFYKAIDLWADSTHENKEAQAFQLLRRMQRSVSCKTFAVKPDTRTFNSVMRCLSLSPPRKGQTKGAVALLNEMERKCRNGNISYAMPNEETFWLTILVSIKANDFTNAQALLQRMHASQTPPTTATYHRILTYFRDCGSSNQARNAEVFFAEMKEVSMKRPDKVKVDTTAYNLLIGTHVNSKALGSLDKVLELYDEMLASSVEPDFDSYSILCFALSNSDDKTMLEKADLMLARIEQSDCDDEPNQQPQRRHFLPLILGFCRALDPDRAEHILDRQIAQYTRRAMCATLKPIPSCIDKVTMAFIQRLRLEQANAFVAKIWKLQEEGKLLKDSGPGIKTIAALVKAWQQSTHPNKNPRILEWKAAVVVE